VSKLYVVATPIGNLEDISFRALETLKNVSLILAEDTRVSSKLLRHYNISTPYKSYHAFNEHHALAYFIKLLQSGQSLALISDAGMPGISDPGFLLIRECIAENIAVEVIPGASAFVTALVGSGLPSDKFYFEGFLPLKKGRQTRIKFLAELECTFILYESPHRLIKCLVQLIEQCGADRPACVARELSKIHETYDRGTLAEILSVYQAKAKVQGEIVLLVAGKA
jgi:16S rRNA (cytidine1402-2'-O)-methyltransferase